MKLAAGDLKCWMEIQRSTLVRDKYGSEVKTYSTIGRRPAEITALRLGERLVASQLQPEITHRIRIRPFPGLRASDKLLFRDRTFQILTPPVNQPNEVAEYMELLVKEINDSPTSG